MSTSASSVSVDDQYVEEDSLFGNYGRGLPGAYANDSLLDADDELGPHPEEEDSAVGSLPSARSPPRGTMEDSTVTLEAMAQGVAESEVADLQAILLRQGQSSRPPNVHLLPRRSITDYYPVSLPSPYAV